MPDFINTHDTEILKREFDKIAKPKRHLLKLVEKGLELVPEESLGPVKLSVLRRIWKRFLEDKAIRAAAWRWLRPDLRLEIDDLTRLQVRVELHHMKPAEFYERLIDACQDIAEEFRPLSRFVDARIADIEFKVRGGSTFPDPASSSFELFQRGLLVAALESPQEALPSATALLRELLAAAAVAARGVLDREPEQECGFNANLMVPIDCSSAISGIPECLENLRDAPGAQMASWLWNGLRQEVHGLFVVVAETRRSNYIGFWVPDVRSRGKLLPGAPHAFHSRKAQAVFVDDLPPFPIEDEEVAARWRKYFSGEKAGSFAGRMFVSFPVMSSSGAHQTDPVAILNLDVTDRVWTRAYSRAWLDRASSVINQWTATVWHAFGVRWNAANNLGGPMLRPLELPDFSGLRPNHLIAGSTKEPAGLLEGPEGPARQVAILFADIVGSTAMFAKAGDLATRNAFDEFLARARFWQHPHRGEIVKYFGDGFLAVFDDVGNALAFATEIQRSLSENPIVVAWGHLAVRMGLHAGRVQRTRTSYGPDVFGADINLAAGLTGLAEPGEVVVSEATRVALPEEEQRVLGPVERVAIKGFTELVEVSRIRPSGV